MRTRHRSLATLVLTLAVAACTGDDPPITAATTTPPPVTPVETPSESPTPPALPDEPPATSGPVVADCEHGWVTPPAGSPRFLEPLGIIRRTTGVQGPLEVVDLRYFEGPESPPSEQGYLLLVQRWYVKLYAVDHLAFQGRFLVEARRFGRGLAAVAPYDTFGFRSPDWIGFQYDSADLEPHAYDGLPGAWTGVAYDFVEGGEGLEIPGLPDEVVGCLDAT
jgi:hypothetical protein